MEGKDEKEDGLGDVNGRGGRGGRSGRSVRSCFLSRLTASLFSMRIAVHLHLHDVHAR